jgi:hypothetical protein
LVELDLNPVGDDEQRAAFGFECRAARMGLWLVAAHRMVGGGLHHQGPGGHPFERRPRRVVVAVGGNGRWYGVTSVL